MTPDQIKLLKELSLNECVTAEGDDITALRDDGYAYIWDMWPDGRRRWAITRDGRAALSAADGAKL